MDLFAGAALLGGLTWGLTFLVLVAIGSAQRRSIDDIPAWIKLLVVVGIAPVIVIVIANSELGRENTVAGINLATASGWSLAAVILVTIAAEGAVFLSLEKILPNLGVPMPSPVQKRALDVGAQRLVTSTLSPTAGGAHPDATPTASGPDLTTLPSTITPPT